MKQNLSIWRKKVYDFLFNEGFIFNEGRQSELSKLLKSIYEHRVSELDPRIPLTHHIICPQCQNIRIFKRKGFIRYKSAIRKAGGEAPSVNNPV